MTILDFRAEWTQRCDIRKKPIPSGWAGKEWSVRQFSLLAVG